MQPEVTVHTVQAPFAGPRPRNERKHLQRDRGCVWTSCCMFPPLKEWRPQLPSWPFNISRVEQFAFSWLSQSAWTVRWVRVGVKGV
jgi:hypothetical protein